MSGSRVSAALVILALVAAVGWSQPVPQAPPVTKSEDDGRMSDEAKQEILKYWKTKPEQTWSQFIEDWLTPKPFPKKYVVKIDDKYAYPHIVASIKMEIVREDDENVWLRGIPPEDPQSPLYKVWSQMQAQEAFLVQQQAAEKTPGALFYLDFDTVPVPPPFQRTLRFEARNQGMPSGGRWQMGFASADMNGDGHQDLVFPPRRKGYTGRFAIFLGDGKGGFSEWTNLTWPGKLRLDYGGVEAADLDDDGHQDIIFAMHFGPQYVMYGDGKGDFTKVEQLPSPDPRISSRAVTVDDFDGDGRPDLAFVAEIDYDLANNKSIDDAITVWVVRNKAGAWKLSTEGLARKQIADVIRSGDVDGDGRPDLVVSSNSVGERRLVFLNQGEEGWRSAPFNGVLSAAYHYDVEMEGGEIFAAFVQFQMIEGQTEARNGIIGYPFAFREQGWRNGKPVVFDTERTKVYFRIALGDLNGDGRTDIVAGRKTGGLEVFLQSANGEFVREVADELAATGTAYDIRLLDLDGDGRDDIVAGMVPIEDIQGGVAVWLTRPAVAE